MGIHFRMRVSERHYCVHAETWVARVLTVVRANAGLNLSTMCPWTWLHLAGHQMVRGVQLCRQGDDEEVEIEEDDNSDPVALFHLTQGQGQPWHFFMEQLGMWFGEGREVELAVQMVRGSVTIRHTRPGFRARLQHWGWNSQQ